MAKQQSIDKYFKVISRVHKGERLTNAAKSEHTTPRTFKKVNQELKHAEIKEHRPGRPIEFTFSDEHTIVIISDTGDAYPITVDRETYYKYIGFIDDMEKFKSYKYRAIVFYDIDGNKHRVTTNPDIYRATIEQLDGDYGSFFYPERWKF